MYNSNILINKSVRLIGIFILCALCTQNIAPSLVSAQCVHQELTHLIATDAATNDFFGHAVAISENIMVIGAYGDDHAGGTDAGAVYIYLRNGSNWVYDGKLTAYDAAPNDYYGDAVATLGNTVFVGARNDNINGGSVHVYHRENNTWTLRAHLLNQPNWGQFGASISTSGNTVIIGAPGANASGSAYVYIYEGGQWLQQAILVAADAEPLDQLGFAVAISGDTALVGAWRENNTGSAYVFTRNAGVWTQQAKLVATDAGANDDFGVSVALSGNTAVIGANHDVSGRGSAYVFSRTGSLWTQQAKLTIAGADYEFGSAVAIANNTIAVGCNADTLPGGNEQGSVYMFAEYGAGWTLQGQITASDRASDDAFGIALAMQDDTIVVGAWQDDTTGGSNSGSAYMYQSCDIDGDGIFNANDACPDNRRGLAIDCIGRPLSDRNGDCFVDGEDIQIIVAEMLSK